MTDYFSLIYEAIIYNSLLNNFKIIDKSNGIHIQRNKQGEISKTKEIHFEGEKRISIQN